MKIQLKDERGKVCIVVTDKEVIMHDPKYKEAVDYIKKYGVTTGTAGEEKPGEPPVFGDFIHKTGFKGSAKPIANELIARTGLKK